MNRQELIEKKINTLQEEYRSDHAYTLSGYPDEFDQLSKKEFDKVLAAVSPEYTDVDVAIRRKQYVVEITCVDNEIGFNWLTREAYIDRYGNERYEK